jgi:acetate kinase
MKLLILNAGSSSQKSCLYDFDKLPAEPISPLWEGQIDWTVQDGMAAFQVATIQGKKFQHLLPSQSRSQDTQFLLRTLWQGETQVIESPQAIDLVGHRVVHGGSTYTSSTRIDATVKDAIAQLTEFAPIHNPANLEGIESAEALLGHVPQIAVFDTAFHGSLSPAAYTYPGAYEWLEQGIRRYGFHGTSHSYCAQRATQLLQRDLGSLKLLTCHLGNGCSLAAIQGGQCIDTTMGFTPLDGLMMGTRSGAIDPGILLYLMRHYHLDADALDVLLNHQSGLLGLSGLSADMRQILAAIDEGHQRATLAFDVYVHRLRSYIGAMLANLGGLDALIFTAGIGENAARVRAAVCQGWNFWGIMLDEAKNQTCRPDMDIAITNAAVRVLVIHTQEDWMIAQECWKLAHAPNFLGQNHHPRQ